MRRKITGGSDARESIRGSDAASQEAFLKPVCWLRPVPLRGQKEDPHGQKTLSADRWEEQGISCKNKRP